MRIFTKLFLLLGAISAVPLGLTATAVLHGSATLNQELVETSTETGERTTHDSADALQDEAQRTHLQIVVDKGAQLRAFFESIRRAVALEARLCDQALDTPPTPKSPPLYTDDEVANLAKDPQGEFATKVLGNRPYVMYHVAPGVETASALPTLERMRHLGVSFVRIMKEWPGTQSIYLGHEKGFILGYPGGDSFDADFDPRTRVWYQLAMDRGRVVWTDPYVDLDSPDGDRVMTCARVFGNCDTPTGTARPVGVVAIDVNLANVVTSLLDLPNLKMRDALLVDGQGRVIVSKFDRDASKAHPERKPECNALPAISAFRGGHYSEIPGPIHEAQARGDFCGIIAPTRTSDISEAAIAESALVAWCSVPMAGADSKSNQPAHWLYVVETPYEEIVKPARTIKKNLGRMNDELIGTIHTKLGTVKTDMAVLLVSVVVIALLIAFFVARTTTRPLVRMAKVAQRIGAGDLNQEVEVTGNDEIGRMGSAINEMIKGLKEREFVKTTFKRYVAASVVESLLHSPEKLKLGGEKRDMTVFFSDLAGFTSLSEVLSPEDLVGCINEYLGGMTDAIFQHEGTIDKYIGDAIMCFWGAPGEQPDHALRACKTAIANRKALERLWAGWKARGIEQVEMRIGINSGPMVVGNMGSQAKMDYTVMGDAVNLGSRLEGANKAYGTRILISEETRRQAGPAIVAREVDLLAVKGKKHAVRVFELVGLKGEVEEKRLASIATFERALVAFRAQRWDEAEREFLAAIEARGEEDPPSRVYLERIAHYRVSAPAEGWDGSFHLLTK